MLIVSKWCWMAPVDVRTWFQPIGGNLKQPDGRLYTHIHQNAFETCMSQSFVSIASEGQQAHIRFVV